MEVKLADSKVIVQNFVGRIQKVYQSLAISCCKSRSDFGVSGYQIGKTHGHIGLEVNLVQEILVLIS